MRDNLKELRLSLHEVYKLILLLLSMIINYHSDDRYIKDRKFLEKAFEKLKM
jgi:hypothetical protein